MSTTLEGVKLLWFSETKGKEPPTVAQTRAALTANGFSADLAADIPGSTAFRRAISATKSDKLHKPYCVQNGELHGQLDLLVMDDDGAKIIRRECVAHWTYSEDHGPEQTYGQTLDLSYAACLANYTWGDVTKIGQEALTSAGQRTHALKPSGHIYVIPTDQTNLLTRLERFGEAINLRVITVDLPDTSKHRAEVADAIAGTFSAEMDAHEVAIDTYTADSTKPGCIDNRIESIAKTLSQSVGLALYLDSSDTARLRQRADSLTSRCRTLLETIAAARQQEEDARPRGRRVHYTPPTTEPNQPLFAEPASVS